VNLDNIFRQFNDKVRSLRSMKFFTAYSVIIFTGFTFLSALSIHGSSLGLLSGSNEDVLLGANRGIRADEFFRSSPFLISQIFFPNSNGISELSASTVDFKGFDSFEVLHFDRVILDFLFSGSQLFAAYWWLPFLSLFIGLPLFLKTLGLRTSFAIMITVIVAFSPSVVWWSNSIAGIIGKASLGSALVILAFRKKGLQSLALGFLGTYFASGLSTDYTPWVIVSILFFLPIVAVHISPFLKAPKDSFFSLAGIFIGVLPFVYFLYTKYSIYAVITETVYPGTRRFLPGSPSALNWSFSGPLNWSLLNPTEILSSNQSEASLGFLFFILPAFFVAFFQYEKKNFDGIIITSSSVYFTLLAWSVLPIPTFSLNPLQVVSPERALTVTSTLAPIFLGIVMSRFSNSKVPVNHTKNKLQDKSSEYSYGRILFGTLGASMTLWSSFSIKAVLQPVPYFLIIATSILVGYLVYLLSSTKSIKLGLTLSMILSLTLGLPVNPVVKGLDSIFQSEISVSIKNINSGSLWASDNFAVDAILTANGKSQLSGQQLTGPNKEMWQILDPSSQYNNFWNSGASYVGLQFVDSENPPEITKPAQDIIQIKLNPCSTVSKTLKLRYLISSNDLKMACLKKLNTIPVNYTGIPFWLYEIAN
jgi:hypothetical protein